MADYTQSLSNTINVFGMAPSSKWGSLVWGTDNWGEGDDVVTHTEKLLSDSYSIADDWTTLVVYNLTVSNTLSVDTYDLDILLDDSNIWYCLFRKPTNDGQEQVDTTYVGVTYDTPSWSDLDDVAAAVTGPSADGLQLESGDFILLESGDYILLEAS